MQIQTTQIGLSQQTLAYPSATLPSAELSRIAALGGGLMLKGDLGATAGATLRRHDYAGPLVLDPARYEKATGPVSQESLFGTYDHWIGQQQSQGVSAFVAPSSGIGPRELDRIEEVIADGRSFAAEAEARGVVNEIVIPVNIYRRWLANDSRTLLGLLEESGHTVGLLLTNPGDPLERRGTIAGLTRLVQGLPRCVVLRTDLAGGLGALSLGSQWASVGTSPTHRHATQPGKAGYSPNVTDRTPSIVVGELLGFRKASKLEQLEQVNALLGCGCHVCDGDDIRRFADDAYSESARFHNAAVVAALTTKLAAASDPATTWVDWCNRAVDTHKWVQESTGVFFEAPLAIKEWAGRR